MELILTSILLGFGGFDPMGAIIIMTTLSHGVKKKQVYLFSAMALFSTVLFGTVFSLFTSAGINYFLNIFNAIPDMVYVIIDFILGIVCLAWCVNKLFTQEKKETENQKESKFMQFAKKSMPLAGFLFGFWAMSDPTFWTVVALTSKEGNLITVILCSGIWMIIGQFPLYALTIAVMFNVHEKVIRITDEFLTKNNRREKLGRIIKITVLLFVLLLGVAFLANSIIYLVKRIWIF